MGLIVKEIRPGEILPPGAVQKCADGEYRPLLAVGMPVYAGMKYPVLSIVEETVTPGDKKAEESNKAAGPTTGGMSETWSDGTLLNSMIDKSMRDLFLALKPAPNPSYGPIPDGWELLPIEKRAGYNKPGTVKYWNSAAKDWCDRPFPCSPLGFADTYIVRKPEPEKPLCVPVPFGWELLKVGEKITPDCLALCEENQAQYLAGVDGKNWFSVTKISPGKTYDARHMPMCKPTRKAPDGYEWIKKGDTWQAGDIRLDPDGVRIDLVAPCLIGQKSGTHDLKWYRPIPKPTPPRLHPWEENLIKAACGFVDSRTTAHFCDLVTAAQIYWIITKT